MPKARFPPLSNQSLRRMRQATLRLKTCAGPIEIQAHYGQDALTQQWLCPMRERWELAPRQAMSPVLEDRLCFTATLTGSYEAAAQLAEKWGASTTDSTIHQHVQKLGERAERDAEQIRQRLLEPETRAEAVTESTRLLPDEFDLVIMMDGWMARDRGPEWGLKPAETQAERVAWREMKTALVFRLDQRGRTQSGRHVLTEKFVDVACADPFVFGQRLYALALRCGLHQARRVYVVANGAVWIWNLVEERFGAVTGVLDFYHASEHLWALGRELFDTDDAVRRWVEPLLHQLRHGEEAAVLQKLNQTLGQARRTTSASLAMVERETHYFQNHRDHLHYAAREQEGAPIGSGAMESVCRQFQTRFKGAGKFWSESGRERLMALDVARRNHEWEFGRWNQMAA
jgi:hypothetical protein